MYKEARMSAQDQWNGLSCSYLNTLRSWRTNTYIYGRILMKTCNGDYAQAELREDVGEPQYIALGSQVALQSPSAFFRGQLSPPLLHSASALLILNPTIRFLHSLEKSEMRITLNSPSGLSS